MSFNSSDKKPRFDFVEIAANTSQYRVNTLIVDNVISVADIERKTWYGGWKKLGSLLSFVNEAKIEIEKCEANLKGAKAKHVKAYQDVKILLQVFSKSGCLYGDVTSNGPAPPSVESKLDSVGPKAEKDAPKPRGKIMELTMSTSSPSPANNQQKGGSQKPTNSS